MRFVIILGLFALVAVAYSEEFQCDNNVIYKENECNTCFCAGDGMVCTAMTCESHQDDKLIKCEVGTTWTKDCNTCWCTGMGTICEDKKC